MPDLSECVYVDGELYSWDANIDDFVHVTFNSITFERVTSDQTRVKVSAAIIRKLHDKSARK